MKGNSFANKVTVLGVDYDIIRKNYDEDAAFERQNIDGYCESLTHRIVVCNMDTYKGWENESEDYRRAQERLTLRHEIVHAFFNESGLMSNTANVGGAWALNEEMIDFFAIQGPKIYRAWGESGCLEKKDVHESLSIEEVGEILEELR